MHYMSLESKLNNITIDEIVQNTETIIKTIKDARNKIVETKEQRTFQNTILPMINAEDEINPLHNHDVLINMHPDTDIREISRQKSLELSNYFVSLSYDTELFNAYNDYYNKGFLIESNGSLLADDIRIVEYLMRGYRRSGLDKDEKTRTRVEQIKKDMTELSQQFDSRLSENKTFFTFTKAQLNGMPETWFNDEKKVENKNDNETELYKVTLKYPDYLPLISHCNNRSVREKMWRSFEKRGGIDNVQCLQKIVELRAEMSSLLGYDSYADYATEIKLVKNGKAAYDGNRKLLETLRNAYHKEKIDLQSFANSYLENPLEGTLSPWDKAYYTDKLKTNKFNVDQKELQKYFPMDHVVKTTLDIYQELLKISFTKYETDNKYHESLECYKVTDDVNNELQGYFYLDLYPREGKYGHAAVFDILGGCILNDGTRRPNSAVMVCNFPSSEPMTWSDVNTFFHEFGHVMHTINSKTKYADHNGFCVEGDFVEFPSQMLECWTEEVEPLKRLSKHFETGEQIPEEMVNRLKEYNNFGSATTYARQLNLGLFDLELHMLSSEKVQEEGIMGIWNRVYKEINEEEYHPDGLMPGNFDHLAHDYAAGYYGYVYSEQMSVCAFVTRFENNVFNSDVGYEYRQKVLAAGSTRDGNALFKDFVGKDCDPNDFLKRKGLA